jgi:hypothetical protein
VADIGMTNEHVPGVRHVRASVANLISRNDGKSAKFFLFSAPADSPQRNFQCLVLAEL